MQKNVFSAMSAKNWMEINNNNNNNNNNKETQPEKILKNLVFFWRNISLLSKENLCKNRF
jgi:hypothetical protein